MCMMAGMAEVSMLISVRGLGSTNCQDPSQDTTSVLMDIQAHAMYRYGDCLRVGTYQWGSFSASVGPILHLHRSQASTTNLTHSCLNLVCSLIPPWSAWPCRRNPSSLLADSPTSTTHFSLTFRTPISQGYLYCTSNHDQRCEASLHTTALHASQP